MMVQVIILFTGQRENNKSRWELLLMKMMSLLQAFYQRQNSIIGLNYMPGLGDQCFQGQQEDSCYDLIISADGQHRG